MSKLEKHAAYWTYDSKVGAAYYFAPTNRAKSPYMTQKYITAIVDVASDGTLAGIELIGQVPPPPPNPESRDDLSRRYNDVLRANDGLSEKIRKLEAEIERLKKRGPQGKEVW